MAHLNSKGNKRGIHHNHTRGEKSNLYKHGLKDDPLFITWNHIRYRCNNKNYKQWKDYGGNGVKLSDEFNDFSVFHEYMYSIGWYKGCHISRIGDSGNYERGNIVVLTPEENRKEMLKRRYVHLRCIELNKSFESVYEAAEFIMKLQNRTSKIKTIAENIRCKGLYNGSTSYGYTWEVIA